MALGPLGILCGLVFCYSVFDGVICFLIFILWSILSCCFGLATYIRPVCWRDHFSVAPG